MRTPKSSYLIPPVLAGERRPMHLRRTSITGAVLSLVLAATGASCGAGGSTSNSHGIECIVEMVGPSKGANITGAALITCAAPPPASLVATLNLQDYDGADWITVDHDSRADATGPSTHLAVIFHCKVGKWRLQFISDGIDSTGKPMHENRINGPIDVTECPHL
ncbi:hypothetical protein ACEZCY_35800 [Streptacidiphilus sp. N1-12]|uniref:Uncharacterized protein n=1 Tax=Streptacidiphilus alkalitolerans TaxID=3342712 RepID=A0ABV6WR75_9ACTN